jgi:hypothetical protein
MEFFFFFTKDRIMGNTGTAESLVMDYLFILGLGCIFELLVV